MSALPEYLQNLHQQLQEKRTTASAWLVIEEYIRFFGVNGVTQDLWQMLVGTLTSDELDSLQKGRDRHNLIFFYEYTTLFIKAVHLLAEHKQKNKS